MLLVGEACPDNVTPFFNCFLVHMYLPRLLIFALMTEQEADHSIAVSAMDERLEEILQFIGTAVLKQCHFQKEITLIPISGK